jgi:hypothetical protein
MVCSQRQQMFDGRNFGDALRLSTEPGSARRFPRGLENSFDNLIETGIYCIAGVIFDQPGSALGIKEQREAEVGCGFCSAGRIKREAGVSFE